MKATTLIFLTLVWLTACKNIGKKQHVESSNGMVFTNALDYNNFIVQKQLEIQQLSHQVAQESKADLSMAGQTIDTALQAAAISLDSIQKMPGWKGNTAMRDNATKLFAFYKNALSSDCKLLIELQKDGIITAEEALTYNSIVHRIDSTQKRCDDGFKKAQQQFAVAYGLPLAKMVKGDTTVKPQMR